MKAVNSLRVHAYDTNRCGYVNVNSVLALQSGNLLPLDP